MDQDSYNQPSKSMTRQRGNLRKAKGGALKAWASVVEGARSESMLSLRPDNSMQWIVRIWDQCYGVNLNVSQRRLQMLIEESSPPPTKSPYIG